MPAAPTPGPELVVSALATELHSARDTSHPMRFQMRKSSPRFTSTKEMIETRDGTIARLILIGDKPLSAEEEAREQARLDGLLADPGKQHHRKQSQDDDASRAMKVLRALPSAFIYQYAGPGSTPAGAVDRFTFTPNPRFEAPDLETEVLTQLNGEVWIDPFHGRVVHLEGHLQNDVDFGWGILGRLYKGGWITIDQADVGDGQWRIVRFQMAMNGRVLFKTRNFDTLEEETHYAPVPANLDYQKAIEMLRSGH